MQYANNETLKLKTFVLNIIFTLIITASITSANLFVFEFYDKKFPHQRHFGKRMIIELLGTTTIASIVLTILYLPLEWLAGISNFFYDKSDYTYFKILIRIVTVNLIVSLFFEVYFVFTDWKKLLIESESMKRETAELQYMALKNQVNPHFLFNNLNSLSSLIRLSPDKAIEFVDKFSRIYRYVLDMSDKVVVELKEELTFLQSYYFLQKIRYGDSLTINVNIDADRLNDFVLPLSIQILIENAIKHNEVSSEHPMLIELVTENNFLVVSNNLQKKNNLAEGTGIGLVNLKNRYKHITELQPEFIVTTEKYIAKIPLIKEP
jgi:sensor histidine kinase YesM